MINARPKQITMIAVLLLVLAVISIASTLVSPMVFSGARPPGNQPPAGNFQGGTGNSSGTNGNRGTGQGGNFQRSGGVRGFNLFSLTRTLGLGGQYMLYFNLGVAVIGVILALLCAWFVWRQKRWALNLAIVIAIIFLLGSAPSLFFGGGRVINWLQTGERALSAISSVAIIFMGILPSVRDSVS